MNAKAFAPRKSYGWVFLALIVFPFFLLGGFFAQLYLATENAFLLIFTFLFLAIAIPFLVILASLPSMRYELDDEKLVMKCGFLKYVVPLTSVKRITKRDLEITLWSSLRWPGLALFTVLYADVGRVKMCATSMSKGIILIHTNGDVYGVTPLEEEVFIADLRRRIGDCLCTESTWLPS